MKVPFTIASKSVKYLRVILLKECKTIIVKILHKQYREKLNKTMQIERHIVKIIIFPNLICRFNKTSSKIKGRLFFRN